MVPNSMQLIEMMYFVPIFPHISIDTYCKCASFQGLCRIKKLQIVDEFYRNSRKILISLVAMMMSGTIFMINNKNYKEIKYLKVDILAIKICYADEDLYLLMQKMCCNVGKYVMFATWEPPVGCNVTVMHTCQQELMH